MNIGTQILKIRKEKALTRGGLEKYFMLPDRLCLIGENEKEIHVHGKTNSCDLTRLWGKLFVRYYPSFKWLR